jgi:hypothetical protein
MMRAYGPQAKNESGGKLRSFPALGAGASKFPGAQLILRACRRLRSEDEKNGDWSNLGCRFASHEKATKGESFCRWILQCVDPGDSFPSRSSSSAGSLVLDS